MEEIGSTLNPRGFGVRDYEHLLRIILVGPPLDSDCSSDDLDVARRLLAGWSLTMDQGSLRELVVEAELRQAASARPEARLERPCGDAPSSIQSIAIKRFVLLGTPTRDGWRVTGNDWSDMKFLRALTRVSVLRWRADDVVLRDITGLAMQACLENDAKDIPPLVVEMVVRSHYGEEAPIADLTPDQWAQASRLATRGVFDRLGLYDCEINALFREAEALAAPGVG
jgi:hypothetical protein